MPKRIRKPKGPEDIDEWAQALGDESTGSGNDAPLVKSEVSRVMAAMGRKGGKIGGKRRLQTMTAEERSEAALAAARARWQQQKSRKP